MKGEVNEAFQGNTDVMHNNVKDAASRNSSYSLDETT